MHCPLKRYTVLEMKYTKVWRSRVEKWKSIQRVGKVALIQLLHCAILIYIWLNNHQINNAWVFGFRLMTGDTEVSMLDIQYSFNIFVSGRTGQMFPKIENCTITDSTKINRPGHYIPICTERIFESRPFMRNKIFSKKPL